MNNSAVNFTSEASTNSIYVLFGVITTLDICIYGISILFGLPTHFYVIWLIIKGQRGGIASEFFNLSLSFCELGICLNSLISVISYCTELSHFTKLSWSLIGLLITGRPLFQCLMCVERYMAVIHPVNFLKFKFLRYRVICCTAVWIIILGSCLCCTFTTDQLNFEIYIYFFSIQFLLFLSIQLFCLVAVLRALKQSGPGERVRERKKENVMKRRAFNLILITTVTTSIIYTPFIVSGFSFIIMQWVMLDFFSFGFLCFILAGLVQPVLYLHRAGKLSCICPP